MSALPPSSVAFSHALLAINEAAAECPLRGSKRIYSARALVPLNEARKLTLTALKLLRVEVEQFPDEALHTRSLPPNFFARHADMLRAMKWTDPPTVEQAHQAVEAAYREGSSSRANACAKLQKSLQDAITALGQAGGQFLVDLLMAARTGLLGLMLTFNKETAIGMASGLAGALSVEIARHVGLSI